MMIVREYLGSRVSANSILTKYKLSSRQILFSWIDKFLNKEVCFPLCHSNEKGNQSPKIDTHKDSDNALSKDKEICLLH
ncbi:MAG: hypothetical protein LBH34_01370 [Prevotellaceae bacterium]|jgi:hypothetical protein|nr:hypothetical protein [Prevotellaceae bacterium]